MKTIAIIGGMGPQASIHAHTRLVTKLNSAKKSANIVHVSFDIEPFHSTTPNLQLTEEQKELLRSMKADVGLIACNTAHYFFKEFESLVNFRLEHLIANCPIASGSVVLCSPSSCTMRIFGDAHYVSREIANQLSELILQVNAGETHKSLREIIDDIKEPVVFGCTELSMLAFQEQLLGTDTLEVTIDKIVNEL